MIVERIWKNQPGKYFCISTKSHKGEWEDHFFKRSQFNLIKDFLVEHADKDIYFCPHGFTKARRIKDYVDPPKMLWADLDEVDPRNLEIMPTVAWESSPGRFAAIWLLHSYMTESLNQRLTYEIGADKGGWDLTQVLRFPGTKNYKYVSTPRVRILWTDGPVHDVDDIEKKLPKNLKQPVRTRAASFTIYKKYEKHLSPFVRRELLKGKPKKGKRSEILWKLIQELIEAGMSTDECFEVLRDSPWNKFAGRRDADDQLRRELEKSLKRQVSVKNVVVVDDDEEERDEKYSDDLEDDEEEEEYKFLAKSMADVVEENMDWIWYPYLARGELSILEGDPGLGKSYLAQMVAGAIVDGKRLPSVKKLKPVQGKVAYFDIENSSGSVTKKRLSANGVENLKDYYQEEEPFSIDDEDTLANVYRAIEHQKPALVVFDTLNTYMGKADTHNSAETQQAFKNFLEIARRFDCAVLVLRHLTKSTKERAIYRGQGSIAFTGLARFVMTVGVVPDEPSVRVMAVTKINVTRPPKALTFTIQELPDTLKEQERSKFIWGEFVDLSSDDALSPLTQAARPTDKTDQVTRFLDEMLLDGPMEFQALSRAAEARSISSKTLYRVADELGIVRKNTGFAKKKKCMWSFPDDYKPKKD